MAHGIVLIPIEYLNFFYSRFHLSLQDGHDYGVSALAHSSDGELLVSSGNDRRIKLWDTKTGFLIKTLEGHEDIVWEAGITADKKHIISRASDRTIKIWDVNRGEATFTFKWDSKYILLQSLFIHSKTNSSTFVRIPG